MTFMRSPAFQFYPSNYLGSRAVRLMDAEQRGWYTQLLFESWESEPQATLPNDDRLLRVLAGVNTCSTDVEERWNFVLTQFKQKGKLLYNERLLEEVVKQEENRDKKRRAGEASAEARRAKRESVKVQHLNGNAKRNSRSTPVQLCSPSVPTEGQQVPQQNSTLNTQSLSPVSISNKEQTIVEQTRRVFVFWQGHLEHPKAQLDIKRQKAISTRLADGYSVDDLCAAVRGCKLTPWNMGDNDRHEVYDGIELICRDAEHVDRFMRKAGVRAVTPDEKKQRQEELQAQWEGKNVKSA